MSLGYTLGGIGISLLVAILYQLTRLRKKPSIRTGEIEIMYKLQNNHPDFGYSVRLGTVTDAEGEAITDPEVLAGLKVIGESSNPPVLEVTPSADGRSGNCRVGTSGQAAFQLRVEDANGNLLAAGGDSFTVTTGDPSVVNNVGVGFDGLTPEPENPPV